VRRSSDHLRRFHTVHLLKDGHHIGHFVIPYQDPRFVKGDDLLEMAYEISQTRPNRRYEDSNIAFGWNELRLFWGCSWYSCDERGERILVMA